MTLMLTPPVVIAYMALDQPKIALAMGGGCDIPVQASPTWGMTVKVIPKEAW